MSSEPALLNELDKPKSPPKWCVYYEHDTGDIVTVTNRYKDFIKNPHIFTESDDARKLLMGYLDPKKFAVADIRGVLTFVEKSAVLRLREAERKLSLIPISKTKADVNIVMYINSWKLEVNFNQDTLYRMTGKRHVKTININPEQQGKYDKIAFYLIKDNDPNFLIKQIEIDPSELMEEGYLIFDMSPLRRIAGLGEITVMTKKIFKSYRLERKANFTGVDYSTRYTMRRSYQIPYRKNNDVDSDFTISKKDDLYIIQSNFGDPQEHKIYNDIGIYITDPLNPNNLLAELTLPISKLGWHGFIEVDTKVPLEKCGFLCKESATKLSFDYTEEIPA